MPARPPRGPCLASPSDQASECSLHVYLTACGFGRPGAVQEARRKSIVSETEVKGPIAGDLSVRIMEARSVADGGMRVRGGLRAGGLLGDKKNFR